jgi:hypothetical protein
VSNYALDIHNKPLAAAGLTSYRYKGRYGWIMIGARDTYMVIVCSLSRASMQRVGRLQRSHLSGSCLVTV